MTIDEQKWQAHIRRARWESRRDRCIRGIREFFLILCYLYAFLLSLAFAFAPIFFPGAWAALIAVTLPVVGAFWFFVSVR